MKKKIMAIIVGILLLGANAYAAGDLIVNGKLGVGTERPQRKLYVDSTERWGIDIKQSVNSDSPAFGIGVTSTLSGTGGGKGGVFNVIASGTESTDDSSMGLENSVYYTKTANNIAGIYGAYQTILLNINSNNSYTLSEMIGNNILIGSGDYNGGGGGTGTQTATNVYGIKTSLTNSSPAGTSVFTNFYHYYANNNLILNNSGTFRITNAYGLFIEKVTRGTTINAGIVLDGDGAGADLVFGDAGGSCRPSVYAVGGFVKAKNKNCIESPLSPHDPETGEWIFYSKNLKTGKTVRVNMEKLVKAVEKLTGEKFMVETLGESE